MAVKNVKALEPKQIKARVMHLKSERSTWLNHWQELTDYFLPRKNTILNAKTEGQKRTWQILDNTGIHSNELLAGALHGLLTNPDLPWFEYTTGNSVLDQQDNVRKWLQQADRETHAVLNNSNFQTEIHEVYVDLPSIGTACMLIEEDEKDLVRFSTKFIADYYIDENNKGEVDKVYREWHWESHKIVEEFGIDNVPKEVKDAFSKTPEKKFCIIHAVYPKTMVDPKFNGKMAYISQYILEDKNLSVGEYTEFPYITPRWSKAAGEKYGRSPSMTALPEIKVLNKMNETMLIGAQKIVDPPLQLPDDGFILPIITKPGGLNYRRSGNPDDQIKPIFNFTQIDFGYQAMADIRKRIKDAFYVDQLKLGQDQKYMTAVEVLQRTQESMRLLGPMLGRMNTECLKPLITRVLRIMFDRGRLNIQDVPPELQGKKIDVKYSSLIAKSQRVNEGQSILQVVQAAAPFLQMNPRVADNFDGDAVVRILSNIYGAPQEMLKDVKVIAAERQAIAQAQEQQQQLQQQSAQIDNSLTFVKAAKEAQGF